MEQYISKSALLKFISDLTANLDDSGFDSGYLCAMDTISSMVNNLEVKEVDIEKEINEHWDEWAKEDGFHSIDFAKHFFELGMSVSNKAQKGEEV